MALRVKASDVVISAVIALLAAELVGFLYDLDWRAIPGLVLVFDLAFILLFKSKNYRKWSRQPTSFPNPAGGGILTLYQLRPWQNEMKEIGGRNDANGEGRETSKHDHALTKEARRIRQLQKSRST